MIPEINVGKELSNTYHSKQDPLDIWYPPILFLKNLSTYLFIYLFIILFIYLF